MNFSTASLVEQVIWEMRSADYPRASNRALIDRLFDGFPPWTAEEAESARINTNVNFLDGPKLAADARRSYYNAFIKPANFFTMTLDAGPPRLRSTWSAIVTKEINRIMKESLCYFELIRSQMAATVLHGIGPVHWPDLHRWKPRALDICDLLIPSNTLLSLENLCHFAIYRQYTAVELSDMIERKNADPAWNKTLARKAIAWCVRQPTGQTAPWDYLSPEKVVDQIKQDGVYYASDVVPTINCWDFYYYSNEAKQSGWRRCMVLDTPADGEISSKKLSYQAMGESGPGWLYYGGNRIYADNISQILHFQFGDLSPKSPFKYHTVRSLGWLIYAVCNLQNRLRCKVNDATFENLLNYFRVSTADDADRLTKIDLHNYGVVPEGVDFIKQADRWQINQALVLATMADNRQQMNEAAAQFREGRDTGVQKEKTATEIMAEVNSANAMVGTMLLLSYTYQKNQYIEIARRFFDVNSPDPEVRKFHLRVLKRGVPAKMLDLDLWQISPEHVLGSGNKMLQIAMADKLMAVRPLLDSDAQRDVLRMYIQANSDDPTLAARWVPPEPIMVTESVHDAQLMAGPLMMGVKVLPRAGQDPAQMTIALLKSMTEILRRIEATTKLPTESELPGLLNFAVTIEQYLTKAAEDPANKGLVRQAQKDLGVLVKILQDWDQQVQAQKQEAGGNGNVDPAIAKEMAMTQAKIQTMRATAASKAQIEQGKAAQRQAQRDAQFQQKQRQTEEDHVAGLRQRLTQTQVDTTIADAKAASAIENERAAAAATAAAAFETEATTQETTE
jgi:hypothetical protein